MAPAPPDPSAPFRRRHKFQVFDLVEDRVLSRVYTIVALVVLPIIMSRIFLLDAMPDIGENANLIPHSLIAYHIPRSGVAIGTKMLTPMKVMVRDNTTAPVPRAEVTVELILVTHAPQFSYCSLTEMHTFNRFSAICQHSIENSVQTTDSDGMASFSDLYFNGAPGMYHISFVVGAGKVNAIQFNVSVPVVPAAVSIMPSNRPPATFEIGTAFGQVFSPKATVLSSDGLPLAARTVHAVAVGDMRDVGVSALPLFVTGRPGIPHDVYAPHYETSGSWQALTSENGVATFDKGMKITAASSNSITIALYCDGVFAMWSEVLSSSSLRYTSILGRVPRFPSAALPTDTSRDHVIVVDSYIMRALPSRSIGHLATDAPPDDRVVPLLEVVVNTNGAGGSGVVAFFPGELVFQQVLSNVQVQVRQYGSSDSWVAGVKLFCRAVPRLPLGVEQIAQNYEVATNTFDEEMAVAGHMYMTKFKFLKGYISNPSDDQGIARFPLLAFSEHGLPGTYELQFYCDSGAFGALPFAVAATHIYAYADYAPTDTIAAASFDPTCIAAREEMANARGQSNIPAGSECAVVQLGQPWIPRGEPLKVTTLTSDGSLIPGSSVSMEVIDLPAKIPFIDPISLVPSLVPPPRVPAFVPRDFQSSGSSKAVYNPFIPHKDGVSSTSGVTFSSHPSTSKSPSLLFDVVVARAKPQLIPLARDASGEIYSIIHLSIMGGGTHGVVASRPLVLAVRVDRFVSAELACGPSSGTVAPGVYNAALPLQAQINQISPQYCGEIVLERPINDAQYIVAEKTLTNEQTIIARIYPAWMGNVSYLPKRRLCIGWHLLNREHRSPVAAGLDATYDWYEASNPWTNANARVRPFCAISDSLGLVRFNSIKFLFPATIEYFVFEALDTETYPGVYSLLPASEQNIQQASIIQSYERCMSSALGAVLRNSTGCISRRYIANIGLPLTMIGTPKAGLQTTSTGEIPFPMGTDISSALVNADNNPAVMDAMWNLKTVGTDAMSAAHVVRSPVPLSVDSSANAIGRLGLPAPAITYDTAVLTNRLSLGKGLLVKLTQSAVGLLQSFSFAAAGVRTMTMFAIRTMSLAVQASCEEFVSSSNFLSASAYISVLASNASTRCTLPQIGKSALLYTNDTLAAGGGATGLWNSSADAIVVVGQSFTPPLKLQVLGCTGQPLVRQDFSIHARLQRLNASKHWNDDPASEFLRDAASVPQGGSVGLHVFPPAFGLDYARPGTYRLVFYIMETAILRARVGDAVRSLYDVPPLYSAAFSVAGDVMFSVELHGSSIVSNAAAHSLPRQSISVRASIFAPRPQQMGNKDNTSYYEVWLPPRVHVSVVPMTHEMIHGAVPVRSSAIGHASAKQLSHSSVASSAASFVSHLGDQWPGSSKNVNSARIAAPSSTAPSFSLFLSQIESNAARWSSAAAFQSSALSLQPVCKYNGVSPSCLSAPLSFPVNAHFQPNVAMMALAFVPGNPVPVAASPFYLADAPHSVALLSAPLVMHQFVAFNVVCRVVNRAGLPVASAAVELLLKPVGDLKTTVASMAIDGLLLKQSDLQGLVSFAISVLRGQVSFVTAACKSQGIVSDASAPIPLLMEAKMSILKNLSPVLSKVTKINVPTGTLRCCSAASVEGESTVPIVNTVDKSSDRALMDQVMLSLANSGGRTFPFVVSDKVSENVQMLLVDHTGQVMQGLIVIETAETNARGRCTLTGFQLNPRVESGFYRVGVCYNSQCGLPQDEIYIDNRVIDYSNISALFFLIMFVLAFASPFFFIPNLVDNSRILLLLPVGTGIAVAFASQAYNLVSLQPLVGKIYVNFRIVSNEEILLSSMLQLVCIILIVLSLSQLFLSFVFPNVQFYASKCSAMQSLFGRIGAPDSVIKAHLALEDDKASSIRTEGLFVVKVAPRSSVFSVPQVSLTLLIRHYWTMLTGHIQKLYYRVYRQRPYRDSLYGRTSDFVFPQRVSSTILLLAVAIVAVSFLFYFIVRKLRYTIEYCRRLYSEAFVFSDLYMWEVFPNSLPPFSLDSERTPLYLVIIYDFMSNTLERGTSFYLELLSSFATSTAISVIMASIVIGMVAVQSLSVYRQEMMLARRGKLPWGPFRGLTGGTHIENAVRYLGTQTIAYVIGWLFVLVVLFAPIFAITWSPVRRFLVANFQDLAILSVLIVIAGALLSRLFRYLTLDENHNIRNRKAFSYLEVFSLPLHYAFGFFSCLWRILMALLTFISSITPLSSPLFIYSDPSYASYRAGQYIDHVHNSPSPFSLATTLIGELDRSYIRLNTPTTAEPSLVQLEIRNLEQAEGRRKLLAAWQHLCACANNDAEFSLRPRRFESKLAVGIRVQSSANLIFGANVKAQKSSGVVNMATFVPPKFSSRASILAHNFAIRQDRIKARAAAAISGIKVDVDSKTSADKDEEPKIFIPAVARVAEFQSQLQKELQPKSFAILQSNELKDMVGGQGVLDFERELKKLSVRQQLGETFTGDDDDEEAPGDRGAAGSAEELPPGLLEQLGHNGSQAAAAAGAPATRITHSYRMAQNELHRREVAHVIEVGAENLQAKVQVRGDLVLSRQTLDSLKKEVRT